MGRRYPRPCVRTIWQDAGPKWIPVIGKIHDDVEIIVADFQHIHVDYRFLCQRDRRRLLRQMQKDQEINPVFRVPISFVMPADTDDAIPIEVAMINHATEEWLGVRDATIPGTVPAGQAYLVALSAHDRVRGQPPD